MKLLKTSLASAAALCAAMASYAGEPAPMGTEFEIDNLLYMVISGDNVNVKYDPKGAGSCGDNEGVQSDPVLTIPDNVTYEDYSYAVTRLDIQSFYNLTELRQLNMPSTLEWIQSSALDNCKRLETLFIPDKVWRIDQNAFGKCVALTEGVVPYNVTRISPDLFSGCSSMQRVVMLGELGKGFNGGFTGLPEGCTLYVPADAKDLATGWNGPIEALGPYIEKENLEIRSNGITFMIEDSNLLDVYVEKVTVNGVEPNDNGTGIYNVDFSSDCDEYVLRFTCDLGGHIYYDSLTLKPNPGSSVQGIQVAEETPATTFNLNGTKAAAGAKGIKVVNGRKVLLK